MAINSLFIGQWMSNYALANVSQEIPIVKCYPINLFHFCVNTHKVKLNGLLIHYFQILISGLFFKPNLFVGFWVFCLNKTIDGWITPVSATTRVCVCVGVHTICSSFLSQVWSTFFSPHLMIQTPLPEIQIITHEKQKKVFPKRITEPKVLPTSVKKSCDLFFQ